MKRIVLMAPYNYDTDVVSRETSLECKDVSLAIQASKDEADINVIVDRYTKTGMLPQRQMPPLDGDFMHEVFDFQSAQNMIRAADEAFMALPADLRAKFVNDPGKFVDFCSDPDNIEELRKLGLAKPEVVKENTNVRQANSDAGTAHSPPGGRPGSEQGGAGSGSQGQSGRA